jgi:hypothetical protein
MGSRYYFPAGGRFLSADPLGHDASMSLYDYCGGDPVNGLDPDGRDGQFFGFNEMRNKPTPPYSQFLEAFGIGAAAPLLLTGGGAVVAGAGTLTSGQIATGAIVGASGNIAGTLIVNGITGTRTSTGQIAGAFVSGAIGGPLTGGVLGVAGEPALTTISGLFTSQFLGSAAGNGVQQYVDTGSVSPLIMTEAGAIGGTANTLQLPISGLAGSLSNQAASLNDYLGQFVQNTAGVEVPSQAVTSGVNNLSTAAATTYLGSIGVSAAGTVITPTLESGVGAAVLPQPNSGGKNCGQ